MADSYNQATVTPSLPTSAFTMPELNRLEVCGLFPEKDGNDGLLYFSAEYGIDDQAPFDGEGESDPYLILQTALTRCDASVPAIIIEGAYTCSKLRPGEFGGYCAYISRRDVRFGSTAELIAMFAKEAGHGAG